MSTKRIWLLIGALTILSAGVIGVGTYLVVVTINNQEGIKNNLEDYSKFDIPGVKNTTKTIDSPDKKKVAHFIPQTDTIQSHIVVYNKDTKEKKVVAVPEWKYAHGDLGEYLKWSKKRKLYYFF